MFVRAELVNLSVSRSRYWSALLDRPRVSHTGKLGRQLLLAGRRYLVLWIQLISQTEAEERWPARSQKAACGPFIRNNSHKPEIELELKVYIKCKIKCKSDFIVFT